MEDKEKKYYREKGRQVTKGVWDETSRVMLIIGFVLVIYWIFQPVDDTDKSRWSRSDVQLITDNGTGVQYLYKNGTLTPRIDKNGNIIVVKQLAKDSR